MRVRKSWWVVRDLVEQGPKGKEKKRKEKKIEGRKMSAVMKKMLNETLKVCITTYNSQSSFP